MELRAHNRVHPRTGELFAIAYEVLNPVVHVHRFDPSGTLVRTFDVALAAPSMIHNFALTERHVVLVIGPAVFDRDAAMAGKPLLQWKPELGTRIAVVSLDGGEITWVEGDPFFAFHIANAFEQGGRFVIDYVRHERLSLGQKATRSPPLHRMRLDPAGRRWEDAEVTSDTVEFPRVDDARNAQATRYVYLATRPQAFHDVSPTSGTYNTVLKVDVETGVCARPDFGAQLVGEPVFVRRGAHGTEDDGFLVTFTYDLATQCSHFAILDAAHMDAGPVALVELPQRVPQGLHGTWIHG